ncbi:hypothetical protein KAU40_02805, partial [Candidatus Parcubacteria bacterium]|nr:hypothetical protein [Candidatus Parcubacteria bacterium]
MRKLIFVFCLVFLSIFIWADFVFATLSCTVTDGVCSGTTVFKMSSDYNAHAQKPGQSGYNWKVCCTGIDGNDCTASNKAVVLRLSGASNAHVEQNNISPANYTGNDVCLSVNSGSVSCQYEQNSCSADRVCLVSISSDTNAHVAKCSGIGAYSTKVCCTATGVSTHTLSVDVIGTGAGTVTDTGINCRTNPLDDPVGCVENYLADSTVVLTATHDVGSYFVDWSGDVPVGHETDNPLTITMDTDKSVTATFHSFCECSS